MEIKEYDYEKDLFIHCYSGQADFILRKCTCFFPKGQLPFLYILPAYSLEGSSCFPIGRILVTM